MKIKPVRRIRAKAIFITDQVLTGSDQVKMGIRVKTPKGHYQQLVLTFPLHTWPCVHRRISALWHESRKMKMSQISCMDKILGAAPEAPF